MPSSAADAIYSDDYTRVVEYQSRQFTLGDDLSLAVINGLQWNALPPALAATALVCIPAVGLLFVLGFSPWWTLLIAPVPLVWMYVRTAKERTGGLTERERRKLRLHYRLRQPRDLLGLAANTEPVRFEWSVILFQPAGPPPTSRGGQRS